MRKNIKKALFFSLIIAFLTATPVLSYAESVHWTDSFTQSKIPTIEQCRAWIDFLDQLKPDIKFVSVTMRGTFDLEGITMSDPIAVQKLAYLLYTRTAGSVTSGGHTWHVNIGCNLDSCVSKGEGVELRVDQEGGCRCADSGYIVRPDIGIANWGGINSRTCYSETQTMMVQFIASSDTDGDGIVDNEDNCPTSDMNLMIAIDSCDSGVDNILFPDGCSVNDYIAECAASATTHGMFVSCITGILHPLKQKGYISGKEKGAIQKCTALASTS